MSWPCYLEKKKWRLHFENLKAPRKIIHLCPHQAINLIMQIWQFATQIVLRDFPLATMAWLNLKHVGSLIIYDTVTHLCLWAIEQLVAMICTLHNTFVLSFGIDLPRIIFKSSCIFAQFGTFFNTSQQLMKIKLQCIKCYNLNRHTIFNRMFSSN